MTSQIQTGGCLSADQFITFLKLTSFFCRLLGMRGGSSELVHGAVPFLLTSSRGKQADSVGVCSKWEWLFVFGRESVCLSRRGCWIWCVGFVSTEGHVPVNGLGKPRDALTCIFQKQKHSGMWRICGFGIFPTLWRVLLFYHGPAKCCSCTIQKFRLYYYLL